MAPAPLEAASDGCTRNEPGIQEVYSRDCDTSDARELHQASYVLVRALAFEEGALLPQGLLVDTPDGSGHLTGNRQEQDVTFVAQERQERLRYKIGVILQSDGKEHFYLPGTVWEVRVEHASTRKEVRVEIDLIARERSSYMPRCKKLPTAQPLLLTIPDVAIQLGVCRATVYNLIYRKGLPSIMLGSVRRVHPDSLREWLKQQESA